MEALGHHHLLSPYKLQRLCYPLEQFPVLPTFNCSEFCEQNNWVICDWREMWAWQSVEKHGNMYSSWMGCAGRSEVPPLSVCLLPSSSGPLPPGLTCSLDVSQVSICSLSTGEQLSSACEEWMFDPGPKSKFLVTTPDKEMYHWWKCKSIYGTINLYFSGALLSLRKSLYSIKRLKSSETSAIHYGFPIAKKYPLLTHIIGGGRIKATGKQWWQWIHFSHVLAVS